VSYGQQQHGELIFTKVAKHVALVLLIIGPAYEEVLVVPPNDLGVMTGSDRIKAKTHRTLEQQIELDVSVALNAGIGRLASEVALNKGRNDVPLELFGVVKDVMVDPERLGNSSSIFDVGDRAATRV
jgi:hypothetical protein